MTTDRAPKEARDNNARPREVQVKEAPFQTELPATFELEGTNILRLQRVIGNQAVYQLIQKSSLSIARQPVASQEDMAAAGVQAPPKNSRPNAERIAALREWLMAHVAGHALATETYTFYEVIDQYLGPWGDKGYPIGYGKHYNVLFSTNKTLMANPVGKEWVWNTTILLQEALVDFIVQRYASGTLGKLTEAELRAAAFKSHPRAYTQGGLALVASVAPELIPTIATIPSAEFSPSSDDFDETVEQVIDTAAMVIPEVLGNYLAAAALPAHTGSLARAAERDRQRFMAMIRLTQYLGSLKDAIAGGQVNNITALDQITRQLYQHRFPDQGYARVAREIITLANQRKVELAGQYARAIRKNPKLESVYDKSQPGWRRWLRD